MDPKEIEEAFLQADANAGSMGRKLGEILQEGIRISAGADRTYQLAENLKYFIQLLVRSEGSAKLYEVVEIACRNLSPALPNPEAQKSTQKERLYFNDIVNTALQVRSEQIAIDGLSSARLSKREEALEDAIERWQEFRAKDRDW